MLEKIKNLLLAISGLLVAALYAIIKHKDYKLEKAKRELAAKLVEKETEAFEERAKDAKADYINSLTDYNDYKRKLLDAQANPSAKRD